MKIRFGHDKRLENVLDEGWREMITIEGKTGDADFTRRRLDNISQNNFKKCAPGLGRWLSGEVLAAYVQGLKFRSLAPMSKASCGGLHV